MPLLLWIVAFTALGGALSALASSLFLLLPERQRSRVLPHLVSFATGALLAAALLDLLPEAIRSGGVERADYVSETLLIGILVFFLLEKFVLWRHCHHEDLGHAAPTHEHRDSASAWMILLGDGFHNVLDGILIAAAFMTDVELGIVTGLAVIVHEIPQEVGDLAILLHGGMHRSKALVLNLVISVASVIGGILAYVALSAALEILPYAIALAASSFIYIAVADLIPGLHRRVDLRSAAQQITFILLGVGLIYIAQHALH
jgi:zinc and cadmium transporter